MKLGKLLFVVAIAFSCKEDCGASSAICGQRGPNAEDCQAYFQRWFYSKKGDSCKQIAYSGCEASGFETKEDCEACKCK